MNSKAIVAAILVAGLMISIAIYATRGTSPMPAFIDPYREVKLVIEERLNDPSSVQYRNWKETLIGYCVEVNAKNKFGAYTGFKKIHAMKLTNNPRKFDIAEGFFVPAFCNE